MKKTFKTIIALCLTVAMLSSLFTGVTLAAEPVYVDWFGFEEMEFSALVGEGTFQSPTPVFFPSDATETDVTWSIEPIDPTDSTIATVDENGLVTLLGAGSVKVIAKLTNSDNVVESALKTNGISYQLTIATGNLKVAATNMTLQIPESKPIDVSGAAGSLTASTSDASVATVSVEDGQYIDVTSVAQGYAKITITDGVETREVHINVLPSNVQAAYDSLYGSDGYYRTKADKEKDPGYLRWYLEALSTSYVLGPGVEIPEEAFTKPTYEENHSDTVAPYFTSNGRTCYSGAKKFWFYPFVYEPQGEETAEDLFKKNDPGLYSNMLFDTMKINTVTTHYHIFAIKMPREGTVRLSSSVDVAFTQSSKSTSTDGSYMAVFRMNDEEGIVRVFPEQAANETAASQQKNEVIGKWMWGYPEKWSVGDKGNSCTNVLEEKHVALLERFNNEGVEFEVKKDDIIRVAIHAGENQSADGNFLMNPTIEYVEYLVDSVSNFEPEIEMEKGATLDVSARVNPYYLEAPVELDVADGETYATAEYAPAGMKVKLDKYAYRSTEKGTVDITFSVAEDSAVGTGYYRLKFGALERLVAITVVAPDDGSGEVEEEIEPGTSVTIGPSSTPGGSGGTGGGTPTPPVDPTVVQTTFRVNEANTDLTVSNIAESIDGWFWYFDWKMTNGVAESRNYNLWLLPNSTSEAINLGSHAYEFEPKDYTVAGNKTVTTDYSFTSEYNQPLNVFWLYGKYDDLAYNGLRLLNTSDAKAAYKQNYVFVY